MRPLALGLCACLAIWSPHALAQNAPSAVKNEIRVNANISMSQPVSAAEKGSLTELQTAARKTIYELVGQECKLLLDTIASECELASLNVTSNVQNQLYRADTPNVFLTTNSNAAFRVRLKN